MQCKCGGSTKNMNLPRVVKKKVVEVICYEKCEGCGRQGPQTLYKADANGERIYPGTRVS